MDAYLKWVVSCASLVLSINLGAGITMASATSIVTPREIREPPEWKGVLDKPDTSVCPSNFTNKLNAPYIFKCKAAIIGSVENVGAFTAGPWEDKSDPDWAFLRQYWRTGKLFYFSSTQCEGGQAKIADAGAKMVAEQWARKRVTRWNNELGRSKFRPFLEFRQMRVEYSCIPGVLANTGPTAEEREDDEAEGKANAIVDANNAKAREKAANSVTFEITSKDRRQVDIKFFSKTRDVVWPSTDRAYYIEAYNAEKHTYPLSCNRGEKICYGAYRHEDTSTYWGVGYKAQKGCDDCCITCGNGPLTAILGAGPDSPPPTSPTVNVNSPPPNGLTINVKSLDPRRVRLEFYSQNYSRAWPGGDKSYVLADSEFHEYNISCQQGEKICYGAWREGNANSYWGVGRNDKQSCTGCCMTCGTGSHRYTLQPGSDTPGGGSGVSEAIGAGIAIGSAIGGIVGGGGGTITRRPNPPSYSGDYQPGRSGISGGR